MISYDPNSQDPGQIKINSATVYGRNGSVNIKNITVGLELYEDIMSPFITGKITVSDAAALSSYLPFTGEELLILDIENADARLDPLERRVGTYHIYKMEGRENLALKNVVYTLDFISAEASIDATRKISKTFRDKASVVAEQILTSPLYLSANKPVFAEQTKNSVYYTSNFWTPTQNLVYLSEHSINNKNNPSYLFFENNLGFRFVSVDTLYEQQTQKKFIRDAKTRQEKEPQSIEEIESRILDMSTPVFYDYYDRINQGYYASRVYAYDIEYKRLNLRNFIANSDLNKSTLNASIVQNQNLYAPDSTTFINIYHKNLYNNSPALSIDHDNKRLALLKQTSAFRTNIRVLGNLKYSVGNVVELEIYKDEDTSKTDTDEQLIDKMLSGRYLVTALSHEITRQAHYTNFELSKDSTIK